MQNEIIVYNKWHRLTVAHFNNLSDNAKRCAIEFLDPRVNEYGHVKPLTKAEQSQHADALAELEEVHLIRYSGKSGFIQMNPTIWPPTAEDEDWAIQRWASNTNEENNNRLKISRDARAFGITSSNRKEDHD